MEYFRQRFFDYLNSTGPVEIEGFTWLSSEVFQAMAAPGDYNSTFVSYVHEQKQEAKERVKQFLTETACLPRFQVLAHRYHSGHVVPFVGAGMCRSSDLPLWGDFLLSLCNDSLLRATVANHISGGRFEEAAQAVFELLGARRFAEAINNVLGSHRRKVKGPIQLLPAVFGQCEVLTTNFDYILSKVYEDQGARFVREYFGTSLRQAPQSIGMNPHCLLRLHGVADSADGRILTKSEYEAAYSGGRTLKELISRIIGTRSLLFMGSSLCNDRTFVALKDLREESSTEPPRHYAFLREPADNELNARNDFLAEAEIYPIYYPSDDHDACLEDLLITLLEGGLDD